MIAARAKSDPIDRCDWAACWTDSGSGEADGLGEGVEVTTGAGLGWTAASRDERGGVAATRVTATVRFCVTAAGAAGVGVGSGDGIGSLSVTFRVTETVYPL